tara:strand:+ start:349004 stop:349750 length:747 start_codon:yes stop_codon:yes gene_type:complete
MANYITSGKLNACKSVKHGFFKRSGGVSSGIYEKLNCGTHSHDDPGDVIKNRLIAASSLHPGAKLVEIHQTHSSNVHVFNGVLSVVEADAVVTDQKNIALSVVTADCAPILFSDPNAGVIGAAHAGWQGARNGIIENTINSMRDLGANPDNIIAAIGPCIAQENYEVGPEFYERIVSKDYFNKSTRENHYLFDLESYASDKIWQTGITNIDPLGIDTYAESNNFFSYRRKTHLKEKDYGRQISIILQH